MTCPVCEQTLRSSVKKHDEDGNEYKSCPECSGNEGVHIFYLFTPGQDDAFGVSKKRVTANKPAGDQSWCEACRFDEEQQYQSWRCDEL